MTTSAVLQIDKRIGSGELAPGLKALNIPISVTDLAYGDFALLGVGEAGLPVPVGIERKTLSDFVNSSWDGRLQSHQIPGLLQCYQDIWLIIEGSWRVSFEGLIEVPLGHGSWKAFSLGGKQIMYREFEGMLLTLEMKAGIRIRRTHSKTETCRFLSTLFHWWTSKAWEQHRSHLRLRGPEVDSPLLMKPSLKRQIAALLPGVGWTRSEAVAAHFDSITDMILADEKAWREITGIGKTLATKIVVALRGTHAPVLAALYHPASD